MPLGEWQLLRAFRLYLPSHSEMLDVRCWMLDEKLGTRNISFTSHDSRLTKTNYTK